MAYTLLQLHPIKKSLSNLQNTSTKYFKDSLSVQSIEDTPKVTHDNEGTHSPFSLHQGISQSSNWLSQPSTSPPSGLSHTAGPTSALPKNRYRMFNLPLVLDCVYSQRSTFEQAAEKVLTTTGVLFQVYSSEQQKAIFHEVYCDQTRPPSMAAICELCCVAAVGTQYSAGQIGPQTGEELYSIAKHLLDDVITLSPLRAMKVSTLLAVYNIVNHATVSLVYIGMFRCPYHWCKGPFTTYFELMSTLILSLGDLGLSLARRERLHERRCPRHIDPTVWTDYNKVWRTLIIQKWFGIVPSTTCH